MMNRGDYSVERCPTGIPGFDVLCNGGLVRNSINAVLGGPGAGKTIFCLQFLYNGVAKFRENGLYISFEPDVIEIFKDAAIFGWDFQKLDSAGLCRVMRVSPLTDTQELKDELTKAIAKFQIRRICLDPVGLFRADVENSAKLRMMLFDLTSLLKRLNVTVLLADETAASDSEEIGMAASDAKEQYIKFLVDGIIDLYSSGLGGVGDRAVRIAKMRRTNHSRGPQPMQITNQGIQIISEQTGNDRRAKKGLF